MARPPLRLRHWKQRFEPGARFVFRRLTRWGDRAYQPGDPIPEDLQQNTRRLRAMWDARRIELAEFPELNVKTGRPVEEHRKTGEMSPQERIAAIAEAIAGLDPEDKKLFTKAGPPRVNVLEKRLGYDITEDERDAAWELFLEKKAAA